jgi:hypothetical protein
VFFSLEPHWESGGIENDWHSVVNTFQFWYQIARLGHKHYFMAVSALNCCFGGAGNEKVKGCKEQGPPSAQAYVMWYRTTFILTPNCVRHPFVITVRHYHTARCFDSRLEKTFLFDLVKSGVDDQIGPKFNKTPLHRFH